MTAIPAPSITLSSARIVQRHVNSLLLALFLRMHSSNDGDRTKLTLHWFFAPDDSPGQQFVAWLTASPDEFDRAVKQLVRGTCLEGRSLSSITGETRLALRDLEERWLGESRNINHKLQAASDGPYKRPWRWRSSATKTSTCSAIWRRLHSCRAMASRLTW